MKRGSFKYVVVATVAVAALFTGCKSTKTETTQILNEPESQDLAKASDAVAESYDLADQAINTLGSSAGKNGFISDDFSAKSDATVFNNTRWSGCGSVTRDSITLDQVVPAALQAGFTSGAKVKRLVISFDGACGDAVPRSGNIVVYWQGNWWSATSRTVRIWSGNVPGTYAVYTESGTRHFINKFVQAVPFAFSTANPTGSVFPTHHVSVYDSLVIGSDLNGAVPTVSIYKANKNRIWVRGWQPLAGATPEFGALAPRNYVWQVTDWTPTSGVGLPAGSITGEAGQRKNGRTYVAHITYPLTWTPSCNWMVAGRMEVSVQGGSTRTITWGTTPLPDNWWAQVPPYTLPCVKVATITADGITSNFNY